MEERYTNGSNNRPDTPDGELFTATSNNEPAAESLDPLEPTSLEKEEVPTVASTLLAEFEPLPSPPDQADNSELTAPTLPVISLDPVASTVINQPTHRAVKRLVIGTIAVVLLLVGIVVLVARGGFITPPVVTPNQAVSVLPSQTVLPVLSVTPDHDQLVVNSNLIAKGSLYLGHGNFFGQILPTGLSANQQYLLPNASGTICLDANNCGYVTPGELAAAVQQAVTTLNNQRTNLTIQGTANQVVVTTAGNTITLSLPQDIALGSAPQFAGLSLTAAGTQNGYVLCDISNNCNYAGGSNAFIQGGNAFGATALLGTTDNQALSFITNNLAHLSISTAGVISLGGSSNDRLTVAAEIVGAAPLVFQGSTDDVHTTTLAVADPTSSNTITLPNSSGILCLNTGNCAGSGGYGDVLQGGNAFNATMVLGTNDPFGFNLKTNNLDRLTIDTTGAATFTGPLTIQGNTIIGTNTSNRISFNGQVTGGTPLIFQGVTDDGNYTQFIVEDPTAIRTILLPNDDGTICLTSGNCAGSGGNGDVLQGGNNFNATMILGTNDDFDFNLKTNNINRLLITNTGAATFTGPLTVDGSTVLGTNDTTRLTINAQIQGGIPFVFQGATDDGFVTQFIVADPTATRTILLPNDDGTICLSSGNCAGQGGNGDVLQGGNNFGADMVLGTNDDYGFSLKTDNVNRLTILNTGQIGIGTPTPQAALTIQQSANTNASGIRIYANGDDGQEFQLYRSSSSTSVIDAGHYLIVRAYDDGVVFRTGTASSYGNFALAAPVFQSGAVITPYNAAGQGLVIQGQPGQTANLQQWQNSAGTVLGSISNEGRLSLDKGDFGAAGSRLVITGGAAAFNSSYVNTVFNSGDSGYGQQIDFRAGSSRGTIFNILNQPGTTGGILTFSYGYNNFGTQFRDGQASFGGVSPLGQVDIRSGATNRIGLIVQGATSQSANLQEWQDSAGTPLASVSASGVGSFANLLQNSNQVCDISNNCSYASATNAILQGGNSFTATMSIGTNDNQGLRFKTNGVEQVAILTSGFVGIGTMAPIKPLHVVYAGDTGLILANTGNSLGAGTGIEFKYSSGLSDANSRIARILPSLQAGGGGDLFFQTAPSSAGAYTTKLTILRDGNVGIGDTTPDAQLDVQASSTATIGLIVQGATSQSANLQEWQDSAGTPLASVSASGVGSFANLLQNSNQVCDISNNCNYASSTTAFIQGGNTFGAPAVLGTNDNNSLAFKTNTQTYFTLTTAGVLQGSNGAKLSVPGAGTNSEVFGLGATAAGTNSVSLGNGAVSGGNHSVAIGSGSSAGSSATALGRSTNAAFGSSIAIGRGATTTANGQLVIGSESFTVTSGYFGNGVTASGPLGFTFNATGGSGTNTAGASLLFAGGRSTGSAAGGDIVLQTAAAGSSGSSLNNLTERLRVTSTGLVGINTGSNPGAQLHVQAGTTGTIGAIIQGATSQTANLQEWQDSTGAVLASISAAGDLQVVNATVTGTLTVTGAAIFNNTLTVNGHIITGNTSGSTTVVAGAGAGSGGSASISGNDTSGTITVNIGTGAVADTLATVTFASAYGNAPQVVITPKDIPGGGIYPQFHYDAGTTTFDLKAFNALTDSGTYTFTYFIVE